MTEATPDDRTRNASIFYRLEKIMAIDTPLPKKLVSLNVFADPGIIQNALIYGKQANGQPQPRSLLDKNVVVPVRLTLLK